MIIQEIYAEIEMVTHISRVFVGSNTLGYAVQVHAYVEWLIAASLAVAVDAHAKGRGVLPTFPPTRRGDANARHRRRFQKAFRSTIQGSFADVVPVKWLGFTIL